MSIFKQIYSEKFEKMKMKLERTIEIERFRLAFGWSPYKHQWQSYSIKTVGGFILVHYAN